MIQPLIVTFGTTISFYRQNPLQGFFVLLGLALGCGLFASVAQINATAKASYTDADQIFGASAQLKITDRQNTEVAMVNVILMRIMTMFVTSKKYMDV